MKIVSISGTPGTGKTTLSNILKGELKKQGFDTEVITQDQLIKITDSKLGYDYEKNAKIIDEKKMKKEFNKYIQKNKSHFSNKIILIDSHISHELDVDLCIITKCDLTELKDRLIKRNYNANKIKDNLDSEIFDICAVEAQEYGLKVIYYCTSKLKYQLKCNSITEIIEIIKKL